MKVRNGTALCAISITIFFAFCISTGASIRCWNCNSKFDPRCGDDSFNNKTLEAVDCDQYGLDHLALDKKAPYCRKIVQWIEFEKRTIRGCGWLNDAKAVERKSTCYSRTGTKDIHVTFCQCGEDYCNLAPPTHPYLTSVVFLVVCSFLVF